MDEINNLQSGRSKPVTPPVSQGREKGATDDVDKAELSFDALVARLQEMPEIRLEAVEKGREIAEDSDYPGDEALRTLAQTLVSQRIV